MCVTEFRKSTTFIVTFDTSNITAEIRAADRQKGLGATGAICSGPYLARGVRWGPCYIVKRSKYSNRTVTLMQQSGRYSVDNYTGIDG